MVAQERPLIADMWRQVVAVNNKRPALVHMFSTLSTEALDPAHPAHDYFADRERRTVTMRSISTGPCRKASMSSMCCRPGSR